MNLTLIGFDISPDFLFTDFDVNVNVDVDFDKSCHANKTHKQEPI